MHNKSGCFFLALLALVPFSAHAQISHSTWGQGGIRIGASTTTCNASAEGTIRYDDTANIHEYCDGTNWRQFLFNAGSGGAPAIPTTDDGYFVVTNGTWDGDIGSISNADSLCLSDLTANDWMGKADAVSRNILQAGNVKAFFCKDGSTCNNALANVTYFFAVSGDAAAGGASFTTDGSGRGPDNNADWSGSNYFDGSKEYWTGRPGGSSTLWPTLPSGGSWVTTLCDVGGWGSNTSGHSGTAGSSNDTDAGRWAQINRTCNTALRLACFVHP